MNTLNKSWQEKIFSIKLNLEDIEDLEDYLEDAIKTNVNCNISKEFELTFEDNSKIVLNVEKII